MCGKKWARVINKVYRVGPYPGGYLRLICEKCHSEMKIVAIIQDPEEVRRVLTHLVRIKLRKAIKLRLRVTTAPLYRYIKIIVAIYFQIIYHSLLR
ncbi:hypothetical protein ES703_81538 [subsurface metagenome]